ncbi:MAG: C69 family dipeptidase [Candidatus Aminicenantes bacterium]|nr:C69 family dipeptidase [Candidatus Aminicenantes bacterium]
MMRHKAFNIFLCLVFLFSIVLIADDDNCSNFLVTKGASKDGSVMITYTCDGEFLPHLEYMPAADHKEDEFIEIKGWRGEVRGRVKQVPHTYAVVGLMNEFQVAIGETTFGGQPECRNPDGLLHYFTMMELTLQRAKTAREAVETMAALVEEYGYASTGESFSIADKNEAWIMEMIGPGKGGKGAYWVALRIPDGYICAHANMSRIGEFPMDDPENCIYSKDIVSFAQKMGFYDPKSGKPFSFRYAFDPPKPESLRTCAARVWSMFRRNAPSLNLSPDFQRGVKGAKPYPLWIKPDEKLSVHDVMQTMRDHYEGTDFDMTKGIDAGPFGCPVRYRGLTWEVDGVKYSWERPISTQQTGFSFVSQSRDWLPDAIGGVYWYGVDDTYTTCYVPLYCCIQDLPHPFTVGDIQKFSWDSAWWVFNFVANFANLKYSYMIEDILKVRDAQEGQFLSLQPVIEETAGELYKKDPELLVQYLTNYSVTQGEMVVKRWIELGEYLITKYNDGYVKDERGRPRGVGYPSEWLQKVLKLKPDQFKLPTWGEEKKDGRLH